MQASSAPGLLDENNERDRITLLRDLLERMEVARSGSLAFDAEIVAAFSSLPELTQDSADGGQLSPGPHCSTVLMDVMGLLPADYNFSIGRRDGVCWAWIQPNDDWRPSEGEARHDHPGGSGLAVADTPVLAVACAAIRLHIRLIEHRQQSALHRIMYVSRSRIVDPESDLRAIFATSLKNNTRDGVSAVLLQFNGGVFVQVLEGPLGQVSTTFSRIRNDLRHADIRILQSAPIPCFRNPGWFMGLARKCGDYPCLEGSPAEAAAGVLDRLLRLEYRKEPWDLGK